MYVLHQIWECSGHLYFKYFSTLFLHFPFFPLDANYMHVRSFEISHRSIKLFFFLQSFVSLLKLNTFHRSIFKFTLTFVNFILLLSSSSEFLILDIVFFSFRIFTVFFFKVSSFCWIVFYIFYYFMYIWNISDNILIYFIYLYIILSYIFIHCEL